MKKIHFSMLALFLVTLIMLFVRRYVHTYQLTTPALNVICVWLISMLVMLLPGYITFCVSRDVDVYFMISLGVGIISQAICFLIMFFDSGTEGLMTGFVTSVLKIYIEPMIIMLILGSGTMLAISRIRAKKSPAEEIADTDEDED